MFPHAQSLSEKMSWDWERKGGKSLLLTYGRLCAHEENQGPSRWRCAVSVGRRKDMNQSHSPRAFVLPYPPTHEPTRARAYQCDGPKGARGERVRNRLGPLEYRVQRVRGYVDRFGAPWSRGTFRSQSPEMTSEYASEKPFFYPKSELRRGDSVASDGEDVRTT